ncbi:bifunctional 2-polyprenyl-6-hydroxyphenol methylase/3-demethylubiquinol 3-O-methyltransferase UbiG [Roseibium sp. MMSF_3544]|uniref:class I SAM-dependent methyltransferase n=2 Tax=unclassified Roseibium TaxID=2629323 RepID=UPI00273FAE6E|nr:class I SAM-dependent methyltransferase [Roseibium sp. MMSF_3544]
MAIAWTNDMTPSTRFWDKIAVKYAASPVKDQSAYEKTLARTIEHLGPEDDVLELGCGTGSTALLLAANVRSYLATDFAPGMVRIADDKLEAAQQKGDAHAGLRFAVADVFSESVETEQGYDAILGYNFLHLVETPEDLMARVHGLLKPGGLFISKTVCLKDKAWLFLPLIKAMQLVGKAPFVKMYSFASVENLISRSGFEIIETGTYPEPRSRFVVARKV